MIVAPCGYDVERALQEARAYEAPLRALGAERIVIADACAWFSRPGPRLVEGLEWLGHALHPDLVPEPPGGVVALDEAATIEPTIAATPEHRAERDRRDGRVLRRRSASSSTTNVASRPPIRPPTWPASENPNEEREHEVQAEDRQQARLDQADVAVAGHHDRRAEQAVDRARGAERLDVRAAGSSRPASR